MSVNIGKSTRLCLAEVNEGTGWLSKQMGISRTYASSIANSELVMLHQVVKLAKVFNMPVSDFIKLGE